MSDGAPGEVEVVGDVAGGLGWGHGRHDEAERDALVDGGEGAEFDPAPQGGLSDEETCERGVGDVFVEVACGEHQHFAVG